MRLKTFYGNLDGMRRGLVRATSQKAAAEAARVTISGFRAMWGEGKDAGDDFEPNTLYTQDYALMGPPDSNAWHKGICEVRRR